jgi:hypothetical protein
VPTTFINQIHSVFYLALSEHIQTFLHLLVLVVKLIVKLVMVLTTAYSAKVHMSNIVGYVRIIVHQVLTNLREYVHNAILHVVLVLLFLQIV